jgi:hypothetical protein
MLSNLAMAVRLVRDFRTFLQEPLTPDDGPRLLEEQLARRDESFLDVVARAVFGNGRSPYLPLLSKAGIQHADVKGWVRRDGVEGALAELYAAGVYVTLEEFKGRRPLRRLGLELPVRSHDFDNPLRVAHYEGRSGGSRSAGTRTRVDLALITQESASQLVFLGEVGALGRPTAIWRSALPVGAAMSNVLRHVKIGHPPERWFTPSEFKFSRDLWRHWLFTRYVIAESRRSGRPLPMPEHTPLDQAVVVARWLAEKKAGGTPAYLDAAVSTAVRVCLAARSHGLDIEGTVLRVGSEPFTEARARVLAEAGCRVLSQYALAEVGRLAVPCTAPAAVDEVHVAADVVALLQRDRQVGDATVGALFCSTLHPAVPKVMLNVELGDYGVLGERACGCPFDRLGLRQHLHTIRSYEKLTSEGMHFVGTELLRLLEEVLPDRFGGDPTDYQIVEEEEEASGLPRVSLVASPRLGDLDEDRLIATALEVLGAGGGDHGAGGMMARHWRDARTLRVVRREPYTTMRSKILPLHVIKSTRERPDP